MSCSITAECGSMVTPKIVPPDCKTSSLAMMTASYPRLLKLHKILCLILKKVKLILAEGQSYHRKSRNAFHTGCRHLNSLWHPDPITKYPILEIAVLLTVPHEPGRRQRR